MAANRRNAQRSTGPHTPEGKARSAQNALGHGLRAVSPVVPFEDEAEWEAHLAGVVAALAPQGRLEEDLVDRVALQVWRLRRVARYEREILALLQRDAAALVHRARPARPREAVDLEIAQVELRGARATARLAVAFPSLPDDATVVGAALAELALVFERAAGERAALGTLTDPEDGEPISVDDMAGDERYWPVRLLREALPRLARGISLEELQQRAREFACAWRMQATEKHDGARKAYEDRRRATEDGRRRAEEARREHILLGEHEREMVSRYETTLERSLYRTLGELRLLQAGRAGEPTVVVLRGDDGSNP